MADETSIDSATSVFYRPTCATTHAHQRKLRRHRYKPAPASVDDGDAPILTARQYRMARRRRRTAHRNGEISVDVNRGNSMSSALEARSTRSGKLGREQNHSSGASPSPPPSGHSDQFVQSSSSSDCGLDSSFFPSPPLPPPPPPPPASPPSPPEFRGSLLAHDSVFHETVAQAGRDASAHTFSRSHSPSSSDGNSPSYLPPPRRPRSPSSRDKSSGHSPPGTRLGGYPFRSRSPCSTRDRAHSLDSSATGPIPPHQKQATSRVRSRSTSPRDKSRSHSPPGARLRHRERAMGRRLLLTPDLDQSGNTSPSYPVPLSVGRSERGTHPRSSSSLAIQDGDSSPSYPVPRPQVPALSRVGHSSNRPSPSDGGSPKSRVGKPSTGSSDDNSPSYLPPSRRPTSPLSCDKSPSHSPPGRRLNGCHSRSRSLCSIRDRAHSRDSSATGPIPPPQRQATSRACNPYASSSDGHSPSYPPFPRCPRSRSPSPRDKSPSHSPPGGRLQCRERPRGRSPLPTEDLDRSGNTSPSYPVPLSVGCSEHRRHPRSSSSLAIQDGDSSPSYPVPRPQVPAVSRVGHSTNWPSPSDGGSPKSRVGNPSTGSSDDNSPSYLPPSRRPTSPLSCDKSPSHSPPGRRSNGCHSRSRSLCSIRDRAHSRDSSATGPIPPPQRQATSRVCNPYASSSDGHSPSYPPPPRRPRSRSPSPRDMSTLGMITTTTPVG
jgi:hypothetical protein